MIGERIKFLRKANKMTQQEFAEKLNISRSNIASIEIGRINVTDRVLLDICDKFDVNENWLRTGAGDMSQSIKYNTEDEWVTELTEKGCNKEFARRFINMLSQLDEQEWEVLQKMAVKLAAQDKKNKGK